MDIILVVHDELSSLVLSVFKSNDVSKLELVVPCETQLLLLFEPYSITYVFPISLAGYSRGYLHSLESPADAPLQWGAPISIHPERE